MIITEASKNTKESKAVYSKNERANKAMADIAKAGVSVGQRGVLAVNVASGRLSVMPMEFGAALDSAMQQIISAFGIQIEEGDKPMFAINQWLNRSY